MVDSQRKFQIQDMIAELAANFLRQESNRQSLITITRADVAPNLSRATIYFTVMPVSYEQTVLDFTRRRRSDFKEFVKKNSALRRIPFFEFEIDSGEKNRQHLDEISERVHNKEH